MQVFTGPQWLLELFQGHKNEKGTAMINPVFDKYDRPVLGVKVLQDPEWKGMGSVTSPEGVTGPITDFIEFITYEPKEEEDLT